MCFCFNINYFKELFCTYVYILIVTMIVLLFSVTANTTRQSPNQTEASCRLETTLRARWQGSSWSWRVWSLNTSRTTSGPKDTMYGSSAFLELGVATIDAILYFYTYTIQSAVFSKSVTYSFNSIWEMRNIHFWGNA